MTALDPPPRYRSWRALCGRPSAAGGRPSSTARWARKTHTHTSTLPPFRHCCPPHLNALDHRPRPPFSILHSPYHPATSHTAAAVVHTTSCICTALHRTSHHPAITHAHPATSHTAAAVVHTTHCICTTLHCTCTPPTHHPRPPSHLPHRCCCSAHHAPHLHHSALICIKPAPLCTVM